MARRFCSCRSVASTRCRSATSALKTRLRTDALIMNMISIRKDSLGVVAFGAPAARASQTAKPERMRVQVAVSREPHRRAAHNSSATARMLNALLFTVSSSSGLKTKRPTTLAARNAGCQDLVPIERSEIVDRPEDDTPRNDKQAGRLP